MTAGRRLLVSHLLCGLLGCAPRTVPPHLQVRPVEAAAPEVAPTTMEAALRLAVGRDPLVRRVTPRGSGFWVGAPQGAALEAWARVARRQDPPPRDWGELEVRHAGTVAVPLARGARLAAMEVLVATGSEATDDQIGAWLGPVRLDERPPALMARAPLAWIRDDPALARRDALWMAERRVLLGWFDDPSLPLGPVAAALEPGVYDRLIDSPTGALLLARAAGAADPAAASRGAAALSRATVLALEQVSADTSAEREAWQARRTAVAAELGLAAGLDPIDALLTSARVELSRDAAAERSTGLALVALTAARLRDRCPEGACGGLDRVATLEVARRWEASVGPLSTLWALVALKAAIDGVEVTHDKPTFYRGLVPLSDALLGTRGGTVDSALLRAHAADGSAWLALSRMSGGPDTTAFEDALRSLKAELARQAAKATQEAALPEAAPFITRIATRARP